VRRPAFYVMLAEGAVFAVGVRDVEHGAVGVWAAMERGFPRLLGAGDDADGRDFPPPRIRGVGNGFTWSVAWLVGFVLWPFVAVALQKRTGSFADGADGGRGVVVRIGLRWEGFGHDRGVRNSYD